MNKNSSLSVPIIVFLIFLTLKLCGVIGWSWWWITAPIWGVFVLFILAIILYFVFVVIGSGKKR